MAMNKRKREAIQALVAADTHTAASELCDVPIRTIQRWLKNHEFYAEYQQALSAHFAAMEDQSESRIRQNGLAALQAVEDIMNDTKASAPVRLRAAQFLWDRSVRANEAAKSAAKSAAEEARNAGPI